MFTATVVRRKNHVGKWCAYHANGVGIHCDSKCTFRAVTFSTERRDYSLMLFHRACIYKYTECGISYRPISTISGNRRRVSLLRWKTLGEKVANVHSRRLQHRSACLLSRAENTKSVLQVYIKILLPTVARPCVMRNKI